MTGASSGDSRAGESGRVASPENERRVVLCPTKTPELHSLGEFPMSCYRCHVEADS